MQPFTIYDRIESLLIKEVDMNLGQIFPSGTAKNGKILGKSYRDKYLYRRI